MLRLIVAAVLTGCRQAELLGLHRDAVDLASGEITLTKTKNGTLERQPLLSVYELGSNYFERESRRQLVFFQQQPAAPLEFVDYFTQPWLLSMAE